MFQALGLSGRPFSEALGGSYISGRRSRTSSAGSCRLRPICMFGGTRCLLRRVARQEACVCDAQQVVVLSHEIHDPAVCEASSLGHPALFLHSGTQLCFELSAAAQFPPRPGLSPQHAIYSYYLLIVEVWSYLAQH